MLTLADFGGRSVGLAVTFAPLIAVAVATVVLAIAHILHLAVTVGAPRAITVTAVVVALAAVVLARREGLTVAARRRASATRRALAASTLAALTALRALTTGAVAARVEAPRCGRRRACPLHLIC
jgi:hypothetical protein